MRKHLLAGAMLLLSSQVVSASSWTLDSVSVAMGEFPDGVQYAGLLLKGDADNACSPYQHEGYFKGNKAKFVMTPVSADECTNPSGKWEHVAIVPDSAFGEESYDVELFIGEAKIADFTVEIPVDGMNDATRVKAVGSARVAPVEGMWWSSEQPGTGLSFNVDGQGRWFGALYVYDESGEPTFLTLQGESLAYDLDAVEGGAYAIGVSPVIRSEGGQCIDCPWSQARISDTGADAQLLFRSRAQATLKIGSWSLELSPLTVAAADAAKPAVPQVDGHYALILDGDSGQETAIVKAIPGSGAVFTGQSIVDLSCLDCSASDVELKDLIEKDIGFLCTANKCSVSVGDAFAPTMIDKTGTVIDAIVSNGDSTTHVQLRHLSSRQP